MQKKNIVRGYCDGSCLLATTKAGGWGVVIEHETDKVIFVEKASARVKKTTNNEMELMAMLECLKRIPTGVGVNTITIYSDSKYTLSGLVRDGSGIINVPTSEIPTFKKTSQEKIDWSNFSFSGWIGNWQKNGWRTKEGSNVKNSKLWKDIGKEVFNILNQGISIKLEWVKGHSGIPGNEMADKLAKGLKCH